MDNLTKPIDKTLKTVDKYLSYKQGLFLRDQVFNNHVDNLKLIQNVITDVDKDKRTTIHNSQPLILLLHLNTERKDL